MSVLKNQKTSGGLNNLYINDYKKNKEIRTDILYLVSCNLQGSNQDYTELKK